MKEIYLGIEEYKDLKYPKGYKYFVSNLGNVKNYKGKVMKQHKKSNGYMRITLYKDGKQKIHYVHRLVLSTFKANSDNKPCVNHLDQDPTNNALNNLEWCTYAENNAYSDHNEKVANSNKIKIKCIELNKIFDSATDAALYLTNKKDIKTHITACCRGKRKKSCGYHWCYVEENN